MGSTAINDDLQDNLKETLDLSKYNLSHHLSIKKITDITRSSLRKELINTHENLTGKI